MDNRPIGVFDSGVGGLTVVREIQKRLPRERVVYVGDTARVPYGGKDPATLLRYSREIITFLQAQSAKAIIIACGTVSSNSFTDLKTLFPQLLLVDVLTPGVQACVDVCMGTDAVAGMGADIDADMDASPKRVGFIATEASVRSGLFARYMAEACPQAQVEARACPLFVPLIEEGWLNNPVTRWVAETYLHGWRGMVGTLVLGCTHYPLLAPVLLEVLPGVRLIDMAEYTVREMAKRLAENGALCGGEDAPPNGPPPLYTLYATGYADKFEAMARQVLGTGYRVAQVALGED